MNWSDLVGKKIVALRGIERTLMYVLFDDEETFLHLDEQSPYDYHDCCTEARIITIMKDKSKWKKMFNQEKPHEEAEYI